MGNSCGRILIDVIRKKLTKHIMKCACLWCSCCFCMCWCTKVLQCNALNRHIYIDATVLKLYLVCKTSYHSLIIITTTQHILICAVTFEYFTACVTAVISPYNVYAWKAKREILYCWNIETCYDGNTNIIAYLIHINLCDATWASYI